MLLNRFGLDFRTRGARERTVRVEFKRIALDSWHYDQSVTGPGDEHPVTQFRRLAPEVLSRIDRALVAVHGEPEQQRACRVCGCTEPSACWPACSWIEMDLCSACGSATTSQRGEDEHL